VKQGPFSQKYVVIQTDKLTDFRCHAEPKVKHLGSELIIHKPDSSLDCIWLRRRPELSDGMTV
jgi:hypothetical protein